MARGDGGTRKRTYQRKNGTQTRWVGWIDLGPGRDAQGRRQTRIVEERAFGTKTEAKDWLATKRAELRVRAAPVDRRHGRLTVEAVLAAYVKHGTTLGEWSPSHARRTKGIVERDLASLHDIRVDELSVEDVEALIERRQEGGASPNTIRLMRNALSAAINLAIRRELLSPWANVAGRAQAPTVRREAPRYIPPELVPAFIDGLADERFRVLILTAMTLALRPSEAVGLLWSDVDLDTRELTIRGSVQYEGKSYVRRDRPKDEEPRTIAMPAFLADLLREHRKEQIAERQSDYADLAPMPRRSPAMIRKADLARRRHDERRQRRMINDAAWPGLVFTSRDGAPVYEAGVNRRLALIVDRINRARQEAKLGIALEPLPRVTFYQLRHTGATWMLSTGVPEHELQAIMGHSSPTMTRRYAVVLKPQRHAAADRLDAFMDKAIGTMAESAVPGVAG